VLLPVGVLIFPFPSLSFLPVLPRKSFSQIVHREKRAGTRVEHCQIIHRERDSERQDFYKMPAAATTAGGVKFMVLFWRKPVL
jgi:hypothetical protein